MNREGDVPEDTDSPADVTIDRTVVGELPSTVSVLAPLNDPATLAEFVRAVDSTTAAIAPHHPALGNTFDRGMASSVAC